MCYAGHCNPECDKCSPREIVAVNCPSCGTKNTLERVRYLRHFDLPHHQDIVEKKVLEMFPDEPLACTGCGINLEEVFDDAVQPLPCMRSGILCGFPCGRHVEQPDDSKPRCKTMVPLEKL